MVIECGRGFDSVAESGGVDVTEITVGVTVTVSLAEVLSIWLCECRLGRRAGDGELAIVRCCLSGVVIPELDVVPLPMTLPCVPLRVLRLPAPMTFLRTRLSGARSSESESWEDSDWDWELSSPGLYSEAVDKDSDSESKTKNDSSSSCSGDEAAVD